MHIDDDLSKLSELGLPPLPGQMRQGYIENRGARIWYGDFSSGPTVILLHGGMGNSSQWVYLVRSLIAGGYRVVVVDSRGQGRSTRGDGPFSYELMAEDTFLVLANLKIEVVSIIGWSDGAVVGLSMARSAPHQIDGVYFFACNVDPSGTKPFEFTPIVGRLLEHQRKTYAELSPTPEGFDQIFEELGVMQKNQPNYTSDDLSGIEVPVTVVLGERDEFIKEDHLLYLADTLQNSQFEILPQVSHFAPLQRPELFADSVLAFLARVQSCPPVSRMGPLRS